MATKNRTMIERIVAGEKIPESGTSIIGEVAKKNEGLRREEAKMFGESLSDSANYASVPRQDKDRIMHEAKKSLGDYQALKDLEWERERIIEAMDSTRNLLSILKNEIGENPGVMGRILQRQVEAAERKLDKMMNTRYDELEMERIGNDADRIKGIIEATTDKRIDA